MSDEIKNDIIDESPIDTPTTNSGITEVKIVEQVKKAFLEYSMSVIVARALPDARDGLKPVQRRILYGMSELGMTPNTAHKKSARIVGEVMGKFHPHGDSSIYDAMVRMAQDFSYREPLVDGHGNFGSVDGDPPAAMRYTEARLTKVATEMLADLDKETVDFMPNFDETLDEPTVLPSRIPNLLVNGAQGIAVGMATNIPPHNLGDVIDAAVAYIDDNNISIRDLTRIIKGPDFPTGAIITGNSEIEQIYLSSEPGVTHRIRCRTFSDRVEYTETKKMRLSTLSAIEDERKIEREEYLRLKENIRIGSRVLKKRRYTVSFLGKIFEIDVYPEWQRHAIMECELRGEDEEITLPPFVETVCEVTGDKSYSNAKMSECFPSEPEAHL